MRKNGFKIMAFLLLASTLVFMVSCAGQFAYDPSVKTSLSDDEARLVAEGGSDMFTNEDIQFAYNSATLSQKSKHTLLRKEYYMNK